MIMDTPLRSVQKKAFSILDSTSFPDATSAKKNQLHHLNITPIAFNRTSNPHRMHTFHNATQSKIETPMNNSESVSANHVIDTATLTSSDIDSLADRVASLLGRTVKFDPFETLTKPTDKDVSKTLQKSIPSENDDSSLQLLSKSIMNTTNFNATNYPMPALATHNTLPAPSDENNNNENNSSSSSDTSNHPISFSTISVRDNHSDKEESPFEEEPYQRPPIVLPERLSTIIEASKSNDSLSRNPSSILLEADQILERIQRLQLFGKSASQSRISFDRTDSLKKAAPVHSNENENANTKKPSQPYTNINIEAEIACIEASDAETEYLEPPVEPNRSMFSQTYDSHIFTSSKVKGRTATTATKAAPNKRSTERMTPPDSAAAFTANSHAFIERPHHSSTQSSVYRPKRTICEEEDDCLSQMQKGTDDLRRLHLELMHFESEYVKQHERRRAKKKAEAAAALKKVAPVRGSSSETTSESASCRSTEGIRGHDGRKSIHNNANAKSGKDQKSLREHKSKGTASGRHVEGKNAITAAHSLASADTMQANVARKSAFPSSSTTTSKWSTCEGEIPANGDGISTFHSQPTEAQRFVSQAPPAHSHFEEHRHSNSTPRQVRFDHQHIERRMEPFRGEDKRRLEGASRANKQTTDQSQRCACCSRFAKMNGHQMSSLQRGSSDHLSCLQLQKNLRFKSGAMPEQRPATAASRLNGDCCEGDEEDDTYDRFNSANNNVNKSVQTSFSIEAPMNNNNNIRPKTVAMGDFNNEDYCDTATYNFSYHAGELSRTPPPQNNSRNEAIKKPVAYFVSLGGSEVSKKAQPSSGRTNGSAHRSSKSNSASRSQTVSRESASSANGKVSNGKHMAISASVQPVAAYRLADAFDRHCYQLKARSEMRAQRIKDNVELRRKTAESRQAEIIQTYMTEKKIHTAAPQSQRQQQATANGDNHNRHKTVTSLKSSTMSKTSRGSGRLPNTMANHESVFPSRPLPLITRRVVDDKEMRQRTEKVYRKLPEVKAKNVTVKREEDARRRRLMLNIFKQRLKENAIQGRLNWPITQHAITA